MQPKTLITLFIFLFTLSHGSGQSLKQVNASDIQLRLEKLNVLGTVLYVAAHPDDENTQLISYFANERLYRTGYLSATRGDGGQNLIGPEIREYLGLIRTQELLAARRMDGGTQFFSRASDFGYSKHPDETFQKWNREEVLEDFVRIFRQFRPDVVITRFNTQAGVTHGHHTASAILAEEAFRISGDESYYPEQLTTMDAWQPSKLFWNTSWWFYQRSGQSLDTTGLAVVDVGEYNPLLGESYTEMAARSRSMHKSQGFGASGSRGSEIEYMVRKDQENDGAGIFSGIKTDWSRVKDSEQVEHFIREAIANFDPSHPYTIVEELLLARQELIRLPDQYWKEIKLKEINELIIAATGTFIEFLIDEERLSHGDSLTISAELINRSPIPMALTSIKFSAWDKSYLFDLNMENNQVNRMNFSVEIPNELPITQPYWLVDERTEGMFQVNDPDLIGKPENDPPINARVTLKIGDQFIDYQIPLVYKETDPVKGEVYKPVQVTPVVMVNSDQEVMVFADQEPKTVRVRVISGKSNMSGDVYFELPEGWRTFPEKYPFRGMEKGQEVDFTFTVYPATSEGRFDLNIVAEVNGEKYSRGRKIIDYEHFPVQTVFPVASIHVTNMHLEKKGHLVGYIMGAGDNVPECLEQVGYQVRLLEKDDVTSANLKAFDAIILGVRAFNTVSWLSYKNEVLFDYVEQGGRLIVQYNTTGHLVTNKIAPFELKISRQRVTEEGSGVKIIDKDHPIVNTPNKITPSDFDGWVQERGLYFAGEWDERLKPILRMNDPGDEPMDGSLLVSKYGKGYYIYTGISFFRELPAGVPGAYRLFTNLISIGNKQQQ